MARRKKPRRASGSGAAAGARGRCAAAGGRLALLDARRRGHPPLAQKQPPASARKAHATTVSDASCGSTARRYRIGSPCPPPPSLRSSPSLGRFASRGRPAPADTMPRRTYLNTGRRGEISPSGSNSGLRSRGPGAAPSAAYVPPALAGRVPWRSDGLRLYARATGARGASRLPVPRRRRGRRVACASAPRSPPHNRPHHPSPAPQPTAPRPSLGGSRPSPTGCAQESHALPPGRGSTAFAGLGKGSG